VLLLFSLLISSSNYERGVVGDLLDLAILAHAFQAWTSVAFDMAIKRYWPTLALVRMRDILLGSFYTLNERYYHKH